MLRLHTICGSCRRGQSGQASGRPHSLQRMSPGLIHGMRNRHARQSGNPDAAPGSPAARQIRQGASAGARNLRIPPPIVLRILLMLLILLSLPHLLSTSSSPFNFLVAFDRFHLSFKGPCELPIHRLASSNKETDCPIEEAADCLMLPAYKRQ